MAIEEFDLKVAGFILCFQIFIGFIVGMLIE